MKIHNLNKSYHQKKVLHNISLEIPEQKITTFIGPNGAGKSTLLHSIARLTSIDSGNIIIDQTDLRQWKTNELAKKLSILTQSNHIHNKLTVRELISFGRFPYNQGRLDVEDIKFIDRAIDFMDLSNIQHCFIDEISGGQKQRAFIAMTLAQDTNYILLDEPSNSLDIYHATRLMSLVRRLCDDLNKTIIMVLHELNYASFYSDMICVLVDGRVVKFDCVEEIMNASFLKSVYNIDFSIIPINGKPLALYY